VAAQGHATSAPAIAGWRIWLPLAIPICRARPPFTSSTYCMLLPP